MGLTRRDVYATVILGAGLLLALSVTQGWNWPLMNGARVGIVALAITGMASCSVSGWANDKLSWTDPFIIVGVLLGVVVLIAGVIGLFVSTTPYLVVMIAATAMLWLVTVVHRLFGSRTTQRLTTA